MGLLTDEMIHLHEDITSLRSIRGALIREMKSNVADMRSHFRTDHLQNARKVKSDLHEFVSVLKDAMSKMKEALRNEQAARAGFVSTLKANVFRMKGRFRSQHAEMARKTKDDLLVFMRDLREKVSGLRQQTAAEIVAMRRTVSGLRQETAAEIVAMRRAWFGPSAGSVGHQDAKEAARKSRDDQAEHRSSEKDDLTEIRGIGPAEQQLLNEAGFRTFAQLAESTPQELRRVLGESPRLADVKSWIKQARELA